ncbi:MAG TPA: hypothetical protein VHM19_03505, partial [Polyangiales bacterium]|nr:hypothetical protein [Polyangiales bacterium]
MSRARETLLCTCAYALLALLVTWPLAPRLATHLPVGQLHEATVPYFNLWTLQWNADRIAHGYAGYWDAPIFYPAHGTFALSEPMTLPGLVYAPLGWAFGALTAYGLLLLLSLMANAFAMRRLLACAGVAPLVATCGGALALGLPFVHKELGVLQLSLLAPPLCALAELRLAFRSPSRAVLIRLALAIAATLWSCVYYALLLAPLLLVAAVFLARPLLADARLRLPLLAAGLLL